MQVEMTEQEYIEFKEQQKTTRLNRMKEIPTLITELEEKLKIEKQNLKDEKKNLDSQVKEIEKEIKILKKDLKDENKNETNQKDIQNKFENK